MAADELDRDLIKTEFEPTQQLKKWIEELGTTVRIVPCGPDVKAQHSERKRFGISAVDILVQGILALVACTLFYSSWLAKKSSVSRAPQNPSLRSCANLVTDKCETDNRSYFETVSFRSRFQTGVDNGVRQQLTGNRFSVAVRFDFLVVFTNPFGAHIRFGDRVKHSMQQRVASIKKIIIIKKNNSMHISSRG